ncbi:hypothetical protein THAR02_10678 [Trichoderma harzianum]|uniref:Uncharacterized protein n=1 Tax=Trichoderma harzianum TaxID=5544 RepID=A0A0F9Z9D7_TRIHA|nr:hypothetical protein THAR02_10678 [Trichoderma harzianum]
MTAFLRISEKETRANGKRLSKRKDKRRRERRLVETEAGNGQQAQRIGQGTTSEHERQVVNRLRGAARPSLHLRWRKHCCAKSLVRGARWRSTPSLSLKADLSPLSRTVLYVRSTATPAMQLWHQRFHPRGLHAPPPNMAQYSMQMLLCSACTGTDACADVPGWWSCVSGGGCGCTSKEMDPGPPPLKSCTQHGTYDPAFSASPPGPPVQGYFRIPG